MKVTNHSANMFEHVALQAAHVPQTTLCVTFGAPPFRTLLGNLARCSKYTVIHLLLGTHVRQTTLCVTFGARLLFGSANLLPPPGQPPDRPRTASPPFAWRIARRTLLRRARGYLHTSCRASSVGGSAMHMKWPDGIGREAGIGRTRDRKELTLFRACPC